MVTWDIHPLNADLSRTFDPLSGWESLELVERHNVNDTWRITAPESVLSLFQPAMGCILDRDGEQITSGDVAGIRRYEETVNSHRFTMLEVAFSSHLSHIGGSVVFPDPTHAPSAAVSSFPVAYDTLTDSIEDLILYYVSRNAGPAALADRQVSGLLLPASLGRGGTTRVTGRFNNLALTVQKLAERGGLRVTVQHDESTGEPRLALRIDTVPDVSANVRFGPQESAATGLVTNADVELTRPEVTRAMVLGGGQGAARTVVRITDTDAEALWGFKREVIVDQRQTTDVAEMTDAGWEAIEQGAGSVNVSFDVVDGPDAQVRRDYGPGYKVGTDLPGLPDALSDNVVREMHTTVNGEPGTATETVRVVVGTPGASSQTKTARQVARALHQIKHLERSA